MAKHIGLWIDPDPMTEELFEDLPFNAAEPAHGAARSVHGWTGQSTEPLLFPNSKAEPLFAG